MYVRTACGVRVVFPDGAWGSWHLQVASLHVVLLIVVVWAVCSVTFVLVVNERSRRNHTRREALVPGV